MSDLRIVPISSYFVKFSTKHTLSDPIANSQAFPAVSEKLLEFIT